MPGAIVVGTGFGCRVHVPALRAAGFDVVALVGRDAEKTARRAERLAVPHGGTDLDRALGLDGVDVVSVVTPPHTHAAVTLAALAAGKHILCEKPFALDHAEAVTMRDAARDRGLVGFVGHEFRFATDRATAGRLIERGAIGDARLATFVSYVGLVADPDAPVPEWWLDPVRGGGWLGASGSHVVDQVRAWLGDVQSVAAGLTLTSDRPAGTAEDSFTAYLRMASGADVVVQQTAGAWGAMAMTTRVAGSRGTVWLDGRDVWLADHDRPQGTLVEPPADLRLPDPPPPSGDTRHRFTHLELGPSIRQAEAFLAAIRGRPAPGPAAATFDDGVASMAVLDAIRASAAGGGRRVSL
ncbi:MAG: oxidoreductase [Acidimicrobiales bacterium]|jgi:predicted dehydrogenase|nr:oxidoreductase [Acidimicrobiales bacterium]